MAAKDKSVNPNDLKVISMKLEYEKICVLYERDTNISFAA